MSVAAAEPLSKRTTRVSHDAWLERLGLWPLVLAMLTGPLARTEAAGQSREGLGILRTTRAVRNLTAREAARELPVDLHGIVLYSDPLRETLFIHDETGGIYVSVAKESVAYQPGTRVEVQGRSGPGAFAPTVEHSKVKMLGMSHLPLNAPRVRLALLETGAEDSQWVEVEGIVRSVLPSGDELILDLTTRDGSIRASALQRGGEDYGRLTDAHVVVRATAAAVFNGNHQMIAPRLVISNLASITVLEAAPIDAFATPTVAIADISRFTRNLTEVHRVHLHGRVTLVWPGSLVCLVDASGGLCAQTNESPDLQVGMQADLIGFPANGQSAPILTDAVTRRAGFGEALDAAPLKGSAAMSLANDARLIEVEGDLIGEDLEASDTTLVMSSGGSIYRAILPRVLAGGKPGTAETEWKPGSRLRLRGICSVQLDSFRSVEMGGRAVPKAYRLLLRSPSDIVVVSKPTWWSPNHSLLVVGGFFVMTSLVLMWVAALRRTVERQTKTIRESELRFKHMAEHDALTGLPTRALLHERLREALERCRRDGTGLALLMVDLDHFKYINDTFGHDAGDMALKVTAERMLSAVSGADTVARMGGDEFLVLLTNLSEVRHAETTAAELVRVVSRSFQFEQRQVPITASVGVCASLSGESEPEGMLKDVDAAMYRAKSQGRNRFQVAGPLLAGALG